MSKYRTNHIFTSESVSEGHPDKISDQISDAVLDACLAQDPKSRVACETLCTTNFVCIAGEITTNAKVDFEKLARDTIRKIGYDKPELEFCADTCKIDVRVHSQSADIAQGVNEGEGLFKEQGAGDQGMMFGYASNETSTLMPAPVHYSHRILEKFAEIRRTTTEGKKYLRPDAKSQVSFRYDHGKPIRVEAVVVSHQHSEDMPREWLEKTVREVVNMVIPVEFLHTGITYYVNPTGKFVIGGPHGDCGLTGRKIIVDSYGGVGAHGGGAFSGKDPTKVDRSAAYMARYVAKNIVAAGLAEKCEIQVAYAIGVAEPVSLCVDTFGTGVLPDDNQLEGVIRKVFSMKPAAIEEILGLRKTGQGWKYQDSAAYGHFGRDLFPWEKTNKTAELRAAAGVK